MKYFIIEIKSLRKNPVAEEEVAGRQLEAEGLGRRLAFGAGEGMELGGAQKRAQG